MPHENVAQLSVRFTFAQRKEIAQLLPALAARLFLDSKSQRSVAFTPAELAELRQRAVAAGDEATAGAQRNSLRHIRELAQSALVRPDAALATAAPTPLLRFKVLLGCIPPIWRRIEVPDSTLDTLHEHIQMAMGWTNSHLHQFEVGGRRYGNPELLDNGGREQDFLDSTQILLSQLLARRRKSFRFGYCYDFGDGWEHEVTYEGRVTADLGAKYPRYVNGARACPPEDVGGAWGFADFLEAIRDPKHEEHRNMREWIGRRFEPEAFNAATATKAMRRGLPDWRSFR